MAKYLILIVMGNCSVHVRNKIGCVYHDDLHSKGQCIRRVNNLWTCSHLVLLSRDSVASILAGLHLMQTFVTWWGRVCITTLYIWANRYIKCGKLVSGMDIATLRNNAALQSVWSTNSMQGRCYHHSIVKLHPKWVCESRPSPHPGHLSLREL